MAYRSGSSVRQEAQRLARHFARERALDGDAEGAGVLRDLAEAIGRIKLIEGKGKQ